MRFVHVPEAIWIKDINPTARTLLIIFYAKTPPGYVNIAEEQSMDKVKEYLPRPMICRKCQHYGHPQKYCN
jgi:hypothetical protein